MIVLSAVVHWLCHVRLCRVLENSDHVSRILPLQDHGDYYGSVLRWCAAHAAMHGAEGPTFSFHDFCELVEGALECEKRLQRIGMRKMAEIDSQGRARTRALYKMVRRRLLPSCAASRITPHVHLLGLAATSHQCRAENALSCAPASRQHRAATCYCSSYPAPLCEPCRSMAPLPMFPSAPPPQKTPLSRHRLWCHTHLDVPSRSVSAAAVLVTGARHAAPVGGLRLPAGARLRGEQGVDGGPPLTPLRRLRLQLPQQQDLRPLQGGALLRGGVPAQALEGAQEGVHASVGGLLILCGAVKVLLVNVE